MHKCDEHQTLVHLDVHVCPVFVCVCGGGYIYIHENPPKILKFKDFEPPKRIWAYICVKTSESSSPPPPPHDKYVSTRGNGLSKCFTYLGKKMGLLLSWCAGVCDGTGKIEVRIGGGLGF